MPIKTIKCKIQELLGNSGNNANDYKYLVLFLYNKMRCRGTVILTLEQHEDPESIIGSEMDLIEEYITPVSGTTTQVAEVEQVQIHGAEF